MGALNQVRRGLHKQIEGAVEQSAGRRGGTLPLAGSYCSAKRRQQMSDAASVQSRPAITPRNIRFDFDPSLPADWHSGEPGITVFYDALSLTFPEGERFFIHSVRNFSSQVSDAALKQDVEAFTSQESIHSREHMAYNALLRARGVPVEKFDKLIRTGIRLAERHLPKKALLAATCAYEHYTALFAELLLGDERVLAGAHPFYRDLWRWHAMEEEEHKAVA